MKTVCAAILTVGLTAVAGGGGNNEVRACGPSYLRFAELDAKYPDGWSMMSGSAVVIGCAAHLDALSKEEHASIRGALTKVLLDDGPRMIGARDDRRLREKAVASLNQAIQRPVVTDVAFYALGYSDLGYAEE